ncbi:MAG: hypothetical protein GXY98_02390 [Erysipelothrix sp.]|nr:hypothetical protein [Erysipelothrix sp.]
MIKIKYAPELQSIIDEADSSIDESAAEVMSRKETSRTEYDERIRDISNDISSKKLSTLKKKSPNLGNTISELIKLMNEGKR